MTTIFPPSGPFLPPFRTLLVQGPYHPSAPIHLMLSHNAKSPKAKAIMISPSRQQLCSSLTEFDDEWLRANGGTGRVCDASSRVDILYPPTPAHFVLLLSMLHVYEGSFYHPKTTLPSAPTLLVLHELSALCSAGSSEPTLSSYISLITHALTALNALSSQSSTTIALAVFDSGLDQLRLPVLRPVSPPEGESHTPSSVRREPVAPFVHNFFQWTGVVEAAGSPETEIPSSQPEEASMEPNLTQMRMWLHCGEDSSMDIVWEWVVGTQSVGPHAGAKYFDWG